MRADNVPFQAEASGMPAAAFTRRVFMVGVSLAAAMPVHASILTGKPVDAIVEKKGAAGSFTSVAAALAAAPDNDQPWHIRIGEGLWDEKLHIRRAHVWLSGAGAGRTILTHGDASGAPKPGGGTWGTYGSSSVLVEAPDFRASGISFRNHFDYIANQRQPLVNGAQAVALALGRGADRSWLRNVEVMGHQDSLYLQSGRVLIEDSLIAGSVDFIFGGAAALIRRCEIRSRWRAEEGIQGFVAAPSTHQDQKLGFVFRDCRLTREAGVPDHSTYLGRPWRAGGNMQLLGAAAFLDCWMDGHIHPDGWTSMGYTNPEGVRTYLTPQEARFFEHGTRGPGKGPAADTRRILADADLSIFTEKAVRGDWEPA
ncbi:pectinesterase family protein [Niveispirillum irakense]|uniref:pectinesterase family protein n=1 Tax=Niveispirillum irakense TaxID=34011 RepID=UPI0004004B35|nr:pectinesterase family protein [Niveispirillum irakense]